MNIEEYVSKIVNNARRASRGLATATADQKNSVLHQMADNLITAKGEIQEQNRLDIEDGKKAGLSNAMIDRLELTERRISSMSESIRKVASLKDPVGSTIEGWVLPNGLNLRKVRIPIGVVCIIYESRPDVTADAAALCLKSGNSVVLRGGKEALRSNLAIGRQLQKALEQSPLDDSSIQLIETTDRRAVSELLTSEGKIDVVIPRGGKGLIKAVVEQSTVPVIMHYEGICHTFVDADCNVEIALNICENAKCQRPGVCNAMETLLVHKDIAGDFLPKIAAIMNDNGVELRGCERTRKVLSEIDAATEEDWKTEYLDKILSIKVVENVQEAIDHINQWGSGHSDAIVTENLASAEMFQKQVDSATVYVNASTRFTDGGQFGLGAEIGISTNKLHARGPMALQELTTYKWLINGSGQVRI
jgi:glutamate-5-semialdehyde dehydrogenase